MHARRRTALAALGIVPALALGCASSPPPPADCLNAYLEQVADSGILPAPERDIRVMESVVWLNTSRERPITIVLLKSCKQEAG
jgi:hypothetical protein